MQQSWLRGLVRGPATVSFFWRVSSQSGDELQFFACDAPVYTISGEVNWMSVSYDVGVDDWCTVEWRYVKRSTCTDCQSKGWIDDVAVALPTPTATAAAVETPTATVTSTATSTATATSTPTPAESQ